MGGFRGKTDYHYQCMRTNVDLLSLIQVGIALFNEDGEQPPARPNSTDSADLKEGNQGGRRGGGNTPLAWQFNFKFSLEEEMFSQDSINSLQQAGIDFAALERDGINPHDFASALIPSGLLMYDDVYWISFHGGYDFGYLTKILTEVQLPNDDDDFNALMKLYFPAVYDVKHLLKHAVKAHNSGMLPASHCSSVPEILAKFEQKAGLESLAESLKIKRVGAAHQAGSDSLLTGKVFFELRKRIFSGKIPEEQKGKVWGLSVPDFSIGAPGFIGGGANNSSGNTNQVENTPPSQQQQQNGAATQNGTPSTPHTNSVGLASTPGPAGVHNTNGGLGPMTPGGGVGVFGAFQFSGNQRNQG